MSSSGELPPPSPLSSHNFTLLSILPKEKLVGPNYMDWMRNLKLMLRYENKEYVLTTPIPEINKETATPEEIADYDQHMDDAIKVSRIMIATMVPELQKTYEAYWPYELNTTLSQMFHKKARQERYEVVKSLMACKLKEGESVCAHVQKMQRHVERLEKLNVNFDKDLAIAMVLNSLPSSYDQFILTYHLNNTETTLIELRNLLQTAEARMKKSRSNNSASAPVMAIQQSKGKKRKAPNPSKWKGKVHRGEPSGTKAKPNFDSPPIVDPKEVVCFHCGQKGYWRRSYPKYLQEVRDANTKAVGSSSGTKGK